MDSSASSITGTVIPFDTPFDCEGATLCKRGAIIWESSDNSRPFELSPTSGKAGAFPEDTLEGPGRDVSPRSEGCEILLPLGTALDWLSAGDFV